MMPLGSARKLSSSEKPLIESSTVTASFMDLQCMPARSPEYGYMVPPSIMMPLVVSRFTIPFREAGPLQEADVCSEMPQVARFAETDTPDPLLVQRGTRAVS